MNNRRQQPPGQVRIIGGRWRGTRLQVPVREGLRPTSDRARETLFNWLAPVLPGMRVLDLFAGSGALGLEALSRGAREAVLVERDPGLAQALREACGRLPGGDAATVVQGDALDWLRGQEDAGFELAFVDPPFAAGLWPAVLEALPRVLAGHAWLYLEAPAEHALAAPAGFVLHRQARTRHAQHALYRRATLATGAGDTRQ